MSGTRAIDSLTGDRQTARRPKLCLLTQYFPPELGAAQNRLSELGEQLIDLGWEVEALTALPNYPTGKVFDGYDPRRPSVQHTGRIRTVRVPLYTSNQGFVRRLRSYYSFVRSAKRFGPELCQRPDLLFVESPPLFIGYAARYLSKRWRCPFVFNVSDLWPESAIRMGVVRPGIATQLAERLELSLYCQAVGVTGQSSEIVDSIRARAPTTRTALIVNGVTVSRFGQQLADAEARQILGSEPGPVFVYVGLLGWAQGLDQVLEIAKRLPATTPGRFVLMGDGPRREHLQERIRSESLERVRLLPSVPKDRAAAILAAADFAIIPLGMSLPGAVPSKIYEAMASSLPILLLADGEPARRVADAGCGIAMPPGRVDLALQAIETLVHDASLQQCMQVAGRRAAETMYDRNKIAATLDAFLRSCLQPR